MRNKVFGRFTYFEFAKVNRQIFSPFLEFFDFRLFISSWRFFDFCGFLSLCCIFKEEIEYDIILLAGQINLNSCLTWIWLRHVVNWIAQRDIAFVNLGRWHGPEHMWMAWTWGGYGEKGEMKGHLWSRYFDWVTISPIRTSG